MYCYVQFLWIFMLRLISCLFLIVSLGAIADEHDTQDQAKKTYGVLDLGKGFATYNDEVLPATAIEGFSIEKTAPVGNMQFFFIENKEHLNRHLGIHASENFPIKAIKFKNLTKFLSSHENNSNTLSFMYKVDWLYNYKAIPPLSGASFSLSPAARELSKSSPEQFLSSYGNAFITEMSAGVALYINLQINFESSERKKDFEQEVNVGKEDVATVMEGLKAFVQRKNCKGSLNIHAIQLGGDPQQLTKVFAPLESNSKANDAGVGSHGFDFEEIDRGHRVISAAIQYATELAGQVNEDNTGTMFVFGNVKLTPYTAAGADIDVYEKGLLTTQALEAREKITEGYKKLEALRAVQIPFYTLSHFKDSLSPKVKTNIERMMTYKESLEQFFDAESKESQYLCFRTGFENKNCPLAEQKLAAIIPDNVQDLWARFHQLNFSVDFSGKYALYPVSSLDTSGSVLFQKFNFAGLWGKRGFAAFSVEHKSGLSDEYGLYSIVGDPRVKKITYGMNTNAEQFSGENEATKNNTRHFVSEEGENISFHEGFSFPQAQGHVCLHLPAGAWFVGTIHNVTLGKSREVSVFKTGKIKASVGDKIHIHPAGTGTKYKFVVSEPNDLGTLEGVTKLPLMTTVHYWGKTWKSIYSMIYHDSTCF